MKYFNPPLRLMEMAHTVDDGGADFIVLWYGDGLQKLSSLALSLMPETSLAVLHSHQRSRLT
jgi:hypothetical protein